ncbi:MAG: hypothetical protein AAFW89_13780 [Bacteroidota bacterium]
MPTETYTADFWLWFFTDNFTEFSHLDHDQTSIPQVRNVFDPEGGELTLNLLTQECTDPQGTTYTLPDFIALYMDKRVDEVNMKIRVDYERWKGQQDLNQRTAQYIRNEANYCWERRDGKERTTPITSFDVILHSVVQKWNQQNRTFDHYYEGVLRYMKYGKPQEVEFEFTPSQTHSADEFSKAVWEKDVLRVSRMQPVEFRYFWWHVVNHFKPRIIREYDHYGFVEYNGEPFFITQDMLIRFPTQPEQQISMIAIKGGSFPIGDNQYLKPPSTAFHLPKFDLSIPSPETGLYSEDMKQLYDRKAFEAHLNEITGHISGMVGGDSVQAQWGKLIIGYVFSYLYFDPIYDHLKHVIYLYLYGEGNVGKGQVAQMILRFFGINHLDSLNNPTARSVDTHLQIKAKVPLWVDEFVPSAAGPNSAIQDQTWNSWFELKPRPTNKMGSNNSWESEHKVVRTMPLFCSNFKPQTDHLISRSLILEYRKSTRGPEHHLQWLLNHTADCQRLVFSYMRHFRQINYAAFTWDLHRIRKQIKTEVTQQITEKKMPSIIQDRQIAQFSALFTVYHWLKDAYREDAEYLYDHIQGVERQSNPTKEDKEHITRLTASLSAKHDAQLYGFIRDELVRISVAAGTHDPLVEYIESLGALVEAHEITDRHFSWTREGHLKIWSKAVWDIYERAKRGTESMVRRDLVEEKIMELSETTPEGRLKTLNWTLPGSDANGTIRQKGFYLKNAVDIELFRNAFNWDRNKPIGANYDPNQPNQAGLSDDVPF